MLISELMATVLKFSVPYNHSKILIMKDIGANECCSYTYLVNLFILSVDI
jgi:hypothetical protein